MVAAESWAVAAAAQKEYPEAEKMMVAMEDGAPTAPVAHPQCPPPVFRRL
jgi:hypothetical protein